MCLRSVCPAGLWLYKCALFLCPGTGGDCRLTGCSFGLRTFVLWCHVIVCCSVRSVRSVLRRRLTVCKCPVFDLSAIPLFLRILRTVSCWRFFLIRPSLRRFWPLFFLLCLFVLLFFFLHFFPVLLPVFRRNVTVHAFICRCFVYLFFNCFPPGLRIEFRIQHVGNIKNFFYRHFRHIVIEFFQTVIRFIFKIGLWRTALITVKPAVGYTLSVCAKQFLIILIRRVIVLKIHHINTAFHQQFVGLWRIKTMTVHTGICPCKNNPALVRVDMKLFIFRINHHVHWLFTFRALIARDIKVISNSPCRPLFGG